MSSQLSPAFPLYTDDWLGSTAIALMSPAEEGAYIRLLAYEWNSGDCSLPDDNKELAVLSRLGKAWGNGSGAKIRKNFVVRDGRLYNLRMIEIWEEQKEYRERRTEAGKKGAEARWHTQ